MKQTSTRPLAVKNRHIKKDKIIRTRGALTKDADHLIRDIGQVVEDVKKLAFTHGDTAKDKLENTFNTARKFIKEQL